MPPSSTDAGRSGTYGDLRTDWVLQGPRGTPCERTFLVILPTGQAAVVGHPRQALRLSTEGFAQAVVLRLGLAGWRPLDTRAAATR